MEHVTEEDVTGDVGGGGLDGINGVVVVSQHFCFSRRMDDGSCRSWQDGMSAAEDKESGDGGFVVQVSSFVLSASSPLP
jgi:hypothetical protein